MDQNTIVYIILFAAYFIFTMFRCRRFSPWILRFGRRTNNNNGSGDGSYNNRIGSGQRNGDSGDVDGGLVSVATTLLNLQSRLSRRDDNPEQRRKYILENIVVKVSTRLHNIADEYEDDMVSLMLLHSLTFFLITNIIYDINIIMNASLFFAFFIENGNGYQW